MTHDEKMSKLAPMMGSAPQEVLIGVAVLLAHAILKMRDGKIPPPPDSMEIPDILREVFVAACVMCMDEISEEEAKAAASPKETEQELSRFAGEAMAAIHKAAGRLQ